MSGEHSTERFATIKLINATKLIFKRVLNDKAIKQENLSQVAQVEMATFGKVLDSAFVSFIIAAIVVASSYVVG